MSVEVSRPGHFTSMSFRKSLALGDDARMFLRAKQRAKPRRRKGRKEEREDFLAGGDVQFGERLAGEVVSALSLAGSRAEADGSL